MLKCDLTAGIIKVKWRLAVPTLGIPLLCLDYIVLKLSCVDTSINSTLGNYILSVFGGVPSYSIYSSGSSEFPLLWLIIHILSAAVCLDYPLGIEGLGVQILVRSTNRTIWWLSKCCWVLLQTIIYYLLAYISIALFSMIGGAAFKLELSSDYIELLSYDISPYILQDNILGIFLLPTLVGSSVNLVQFLISFYAGKKMGFLFSLLYYSMSAFYLNLFLLGNYTMPIRWIQESPEKLPLEFCVILCSIIIFSVATGGSLCFYKFNILSKGGFGDE